MRMFSLCVNEEICQDVFMISHFKRISYQSVYYPRSPIPIPLRFFFLHLFLSRKYTHTHFGSKIAVGKTI